MCLHILSINASMCQIKQYFSLVRHIRTRDLSNPDRTRPVPEAAEHL